MMFVFFARLPALQLIPVLTFRFLLFTAILLSIPPHASAINAPEGEKAPPFTLYTIDGQPLTLESFRGSIVILVYWETGQERSIMALRDIQTIYKTYKDRGIEVMAIIAEAEKREEVASTIREAGVEFPVLFDPEREVYGSYGIRVYPSTVIIDREGKFRYGLPGHALSYRSKVEGMIRFMLGDIGRRELEEAFSPTRKKRDEQLLKAERRYNLALHFTEERLYDLAIDAARQSIGYKSGFAPPHILLGFLLLDDHEIDEAYAEFKKALELDPDSADAATGLGAALLQKGMTEEAIKILSSNRPEQSASLMNSYELGRAYHLSGNTDKALEIYRNILDRVVKRRVIPTAVSRCD